MPAGERWRDAWDLKKIYDGGQNITVNTPFHVIPIFLREGASVDIIDLNALYKDSLNIVKQKPDLKKQEDSIP